ncbi:MAG: fibronectin type III domain-containing protein [Oscillospiraceae bacterium]|nr:fibronectin type III domain-containing protein [Oscillospiraceae bacterium]
MSEFRMVSPLLDNYKVEKTVMTRNGRTWYSVRHKDSNECYVLKHMPIPASDAQVRAMILSGICSDDKDALAYYTALVTDIRRELELGQKLSETGCFAGAVDFQIEPKLEGIGYDVYILQELQLPLNELIERNGMTHLRAVNLGIDLCDAIMACRDSGYLFQNIKPENIFLIPSGKFLLGDLGLVELQDLDYASVPEEYIGSFSAPELTDITASPNLTVDLYALGMVLYRIYNGNHNPFEDENTNEAMANKLRLSGKPLPTPIYADYELAGIITKACSYKIENRYSSPQELKEALVLYLQRNHIPDSLIVPPLVPPDPIEIHIEEDEADAPLRIVQAEELDDRFRTSFTPDTERGGTDTLDLPLKEEAPAEEPATEVAPDEPLPEALSLPVETEEEAPVPLSLAEEAQQTAPLQEELTEALSQQTVFSDEPREADLRPSLEEVFSETDLFKEAAPIQTISLEEALAQVKDRETDSPEQEVKMEDLVEDTPHKENIPIEEALSEEALRNETVSPAAPILSDLPQELLPEEDDANGMKGKKSKKERSRFGKRRKREALIISVEDADSPEEEDLQSLSPAESIPAAETPVEEAPAAETPVEEAPVAEPAPEEAVPAGAVPGQTAEEKKEAKAQEPDPYSVNTVSGPKMPTGTLHFTRKKRSRRERKALSEENTGPLPKVQQTAAPEKTGKEDFIRPEIQAVEDSGIDIDDLIASVNRVVGEDDSHVILRPRAKEEKAPLSLHVAPIQEGYVDSNRRVPEEASEEYKEETVEKKKKSAAWLPVCIVLILVAALGCVMAFLLNNYYVTVDRLDVLSYTTDRLSVELISPDAQECFLITCTDNYGNSYPRTVEGNVYTFTGLREKTAYTVSVYATEYHKLSTGKSYNITVTTPGSTNVTDFTAHRGGQPGEVLLNITHEGPTPSEWSLTVTDGEGNVKGPFSFSTQTYSVVGLEDNKPYIFTLSAAENLYLSGKTTLEYSLLPVVTVDSLHITDVTTDSVSIAWLCGEVSPEQWTVTCEAKDYSQTQTTDKMQLTFSGITDFSQAVRFSISAPGMDDPAVLELGAMPYILEGLKAEPQEDGTVLVSWETPAGSPKGGWHLSYQPVGSFHVPYVISSGHEDMTANSVTLRELIPNTEYQITLHLTAEDAAQPLFGETGTSVKTPEAKKFSGYSLSPAPVFKSDSPNASLWLLPEKEDWSYKDLKYMRTEFTADEKIAICLQIESVAASDDQVKLLYVLRDADGQVVAEERKEMSWNSLWFDRRHANAVPLPIREGESKSLSGNYKLEIYINNLLLLERKVVIL